MEEILKDAVKKHKLGATINLFVTPDARSNVFPTGVDEWRKSIEISVKSPAQDNRANIDVIKTVSEYFDVSHMNVLILNGKKNREKTVLLQGMTSGRIVSKIQEKL